MIELYDSGAASCVIAVEEVPREETAHYGIVQPEQREDDVFRVVNLVEKPRPEEAPSNLAIAGRYIFAPVVFDKIRRVRPDARGEIQLTSAIQFLCEEGRRVMAVKLPAHEKRYDIDVDGYEKRVARTLDETQPSLPDLDGAKLASERRYNEQPLLVQGPGAGPEVTAGGVFADLLRLANYLGGAV